MLPLFFARFDEKETMDEIRKRRKNCSRAQRTIPAAEAIRGVTTINCIVVSKREKNGKYRENCTCASFSCTRLDIDEVQET